MLWEELLCRESCNLIPAVPAFCVCVFIPGRPGSVQTGQVLPRSPWSPARFSRGAAGSARVVRAGASQALSRAGGCAAQETSARCAGPRPLL